MPGRDRESGARPQNGGEARDRLYRAWADGLLSDDEYAAACARLDGRSHVDGGAGIPAAEARPTHQPDKIRPDSIWFARSDHTGPEALGAAASAGADRTTAPPDPRCDRPNREQTELPPPGDDPTVVPSGGLRYHHRPTGRRSGPPSRALAWGLGGAVLIAVAAGSAYYTYSWSGQSGESESTLPPPPASAAVIGTVEAGEAGKLAVPSKDLGRMRALPEVQQRIAAYAVLFPGLPEGSDGAVAEPYRYKGGRIIWPAFGPVLVARGEDLAGGGATLGVFYLNDKGEGFEEKGRWPRMIDLGTSGEAKKSGGAGGASARWALSWRYGDNPVIETEGVQIGGGGRCRILTLVELQPTGPLPVASIPLGLAAGKLGMAAGKGLPGTPAVSAPVGAAAVTPADDRGADIAVESNRSITVSKAGPQGFSQRYEKIGGIYRPVAQEGTSPC